MKLSNFISEEIIREMQKDFDFPIQDRMRVVAEVDKFKWKEDESIYNQKKEKSAHEFEVYFDNEFICFFNTNETTPQVRLKILEGILKLYKEGTIIFDLNLKRIKEEEERIAAEKEKTVSIAKPRNELEGVIHDTLKKEAKKKGKRVITRE